MVQGFTRILWIAYLLNKPVFEDNSSVQVSTARSQSPSLLGPV